MLFRSPTLATGSAAPNPAALFADYFASYKSLEGYATTSIYEMNAHSLYGDIPDEATNSLVTGLASGTALAWQALSAMNAGVTRQSAYALAGYDAYGAKLGSLIRLFGLTRDLATAQRFRPTGQALALLNRAIRGAAHPLQGLPGDIVGTGFESGGRWQFALASRSASSTALTISGPSTGQPTLGITFEAASPLSNNENIPSVREQVTPIRIDGSNIHFELPPYGFVVLIHDSQK